MASITKTCEKCGKKFLIIDQEQKFLSEKNLSLPTHCASCRQLKRLMLRGAERALYKTSCSKCGKEIVVSYNPKNVENTILCRKDYDQYFSENYPIIKDPLPDI